AASCRSAHGDRDARSGLSFSGPCPLGRADRQCMLVCYSSSVLRKPQARCEPMSDQIEYAGFEASEFADNPEPRVPCVLLLDTSGSMTEIVASTGQDTGQTVQQDGKTYRVVSGGTTRIDLLNEGLITLKDTLATDSLASKRAEIAIVSFGGMVTTIQDFVTAE